MSNLDSYLVSLPHLVIKLKHYCPNFPEKNSLGFCPVKLSLNLFRTTQEKTPGIVLQELIQKKKTDVMYGLVANVFSFKKIK